jgi:AraC-like DNA-binding protein
MEEKQQRVTDQGVMTSTIWQCDDIRLGHAISTFKELTSFSASSETDVVRFHFGLKGNYSFTYKQLNQTFDLIGGHHNIMYSKGFDMVVYNRTLEIETFGIQFPANLFVQFTQQGNEPLKRFAQQVIDGKNAMLSEHWGAIDSPIQHVIQQVIHCKYTGDLKKLFLLSKSLELLVLCADAYEAAEAKKDIFIKNKTDKEKIIAVRDLINDHLTAPPNLSQIAKMVGLNEYKLKRGFKETFNTTVFGYLADQRLNLAQQYLRDTDKTAAEISAELGYCTPQHFNNAFKRKFGFTPYSVRNNP